MPNVANKTPHPPHQQLASTTHHPHPYARTGANYRYGFYHRTIQCRVSSQYSIRRWVLLLPCRVMAISPQYPIFEQYHTMA